MRLLAMSTIAAAAVVIGFTGNSWAMSCAAEAAQINAVSAQANSSTLKAQVLAACSPSTVAALRKRYELMERNIAMGRNQIKHCHVGYTESSFGGDLQTMQNLKAKAATCGYSGKM